MVRGLSHCDMCGETIRIKEIKKVGNIKKCKKCYREDRGWHRTETKTMRIRGKYADRNYHPLSIKKTHKIYHPLTQYEKQVLFSILTTGIKKMDIDMAKERIKNLSTYERYLFKKLNQETKSKVALGNRFRKEFQKIS